MGRGGEGWGGTEGELRRERHREREFGGRDRLRELMRGDFNPKHEINISCFFPVLFFFFQVSGTAGIAGKVAQTVDWNLVHHTTHVLISFPHTLSLQ